MDKHIMIYFYSEILFSNKRNKLLIYETAWWNHRSITVSERMQVYEIILYDFIYVKF
jgi:hypothetical protein